MRSSMAAGILLAGAGAAGVAGATDTTGNNIPLNGSDSLFDVTQAVITACDVQLPSLVGDGISYYGGGAGVGAYQMLLSNQELSPMGRSLNTDEYCGAPALAESLVIGVDGVSILANQANSCSTSVANGFGTLAPFPVTSNGTATGGVPATCPGCDTSDNYALGAAGSTLYSGQPSFDALALLYFGLHHDGTYSCASPVRQSLIRNWKNIFSSDCTSGDAICTGGLTHAWRQGDMTGATDALVNILLPATPVGATLPGYATKVGATGNVPVGIGTLSNVPAALQVQRSNPYCNSADANASPATVSFGGPSDFQDLDPVRTTCVNGADQVCERYKGGATSGTFDGDLGVVLPIVLPDWTDTNYPSDFYPQVSCGLSCTFVAPIKGNQIPAGFKCPGGNPPIGGACFMPFNPGTGTSDPRCIATNTTKCADLTGHPDGRDYNLATVVLATQIASAQRGTTPFQYALDAQKRILNESFYRIHSTTGGLHVVPNPSGGVTGVCDQESATDQIGCLVDSDPCSVGYSGRAAAALFPGLPSTSPTPVPAPTKALAIDGMTPFPDSALQNLVLGGTFYPLARRLYLTTTSGFSNLLGGELDLKACFETNIGTTAITSGGYAVVPPSALGGPNPNGWYCLSYPPGPAMQFGRSPAPNIQGFGNSMLAPCAGSPANACTVSPP